MTCVRGCFSLVFLLAVLASCSGDNVAGPPPTERTYIMVATYHSVNPGAASEVPQTYISFGTYPVDTVFPGLGQQALVGLGDEIAVVLSSSTERASLVLTTDRAYGLISDGKKQPVFETFSKWNAVNPILHKGVVVDSANALFQVQGETIDAQGFFTGTLPNLVFRRNIVASDPHLSISLPAERAVRWVYPNLRYTIGCAGDDSLAFRSEGGLTVVMSDVNYDRTVMPVFAVGEVTVTCRGYSDPADAKVAFAILSGGER